MRTTLSRLMTCMAVAVTMVLTAGSALAQEPAAPGNAVRPWHYWIAPILLIGGILLLVAVGIGYYVRVLGGRNRR